MNVIIRTIATDNFYKLMCLVISPSFDRIVSMCHKQCKGQRDRVAHTSVRPGFYLWSGTRSYDNCIQLFLKVLFLPTHKTRRPVISPCFMGWQESTFKIVVSSCHSVWFCYIALAVLTRKTLRGTRISPVLNFVVKFVLSWRWPIK